MVKLTDAEYQWRLDREKQLVDELTAIRERLLLAEERQADTRKENDFLRLRLAESDKDCVYCDLPKSDMGKCSSGFPGCARADDLFMCDGMSDRDAKMKAEGKAEAWEQIAAIGDSVSSKLIHVTAKYALEQAARERAR
jgi:hypothetical protein